MQWLKALYGAGVIGVAATAIVSPLVVRRLSSVWPSAQTKPASDASGVAGSSASTIERSGATLRVPPAAPSNASPVPTTAGANSHSGGKSDAASAKIEPKAASAADSPVAEPPAQRPAFDVVRVDRTGETVVAGHGPPKAAVELRDGGRTIAEANADESGQFVILPPPLLAGSHHLVLVVRGSGARDAVSDSVTIEVAAQKPAASRQGPLPAPASPPGRTSLAPAERSSAVDGAQDSDALAASGLDPMGFAAPLSMATARAFAGPAANAWQIRVRG